MKMILCDIGDEIKFSTGGQSRQVTFDDLLNPDNIERIYTIQFHKVPKDDQLKKVADTIQKDPRIRLRFYGDYSEKSINWSLLTNIQRLTINLWNTESLEEVSTLTSLKELSLTKEVKSRVSLKILKELQNLETLFTSISKDIESIGSLKKLKFLSLREIKNKNLDFLSNLQELWISLGSYQDFKGLPKTLNRLSIHQVKGIDDKAMTEMLGKLHYIEAIEFQNLKNVENFEFLSGQQNLSWLKIEGLKNLKTLRPIEKLKKLETIIMSDNKVEDKSILPLTEIKNVSIGDTYPKGIINDFKTAFKGDSFWYRGTNLYGEFTVKDPFQRAVK